MKLSEYVEHDAAGLAALVAAGEVTPVELVDVAVEAVDRVNPKLNAVVAPDYEQARRSARRDLREGSFEGVPYLVKDLTLEAGTVSTFGSVFFRDFVPEDTSEIVRRMTATGLLALGRTNTPEFGLLPTTEPTLFGATNNPWHLDHSPGGSSGGAAAAVAAGIVPMAHGSDGGGSIRIPASACGIFGLKPSRGRMPRFPASAADVLSVDLCVSRSVRDTALFLDATHGAMPGDRYTAPPPVRPFAEEVGADPGVLRIAFTMHDFRGEPLHPDCAAAVQATAELLDGLGHTVIETRPHVDADAAADAFLILWAALASNAFQLILSEVGQRRTGRILRKTIGDWRTMKTVARLDERKSGLPAFEPFTWMLADRSKDLTPAHLLVAETHLQSIAHDVAAFFTDYDVLLTPTLGAPPLRTGEMRQDVDWDVIRAQIERYVPFTPIANFTGRPAMSVPLHWNGAGLPIGSHFYGKHGDEATLLRLAGQLEQAAPWWERRPPVFAG